MVPERRRLPGRVLRTGWTEADGPLGVPAGPGHEAPGQAGPGAPRPRRQGPRRLAAVLVVLTLLAVALPWVLLRGQDPEAVARDYLEALVTGDLEIVRDHLSPVEGALEVALSDPVRTATPGGITGYTIDGSVQRGGTATVRATLHNVREAHPVVLSLTAVPEGPLRTLRWELEPVVLPIMVVGPRVSTGELLLNGQRLEIPEVHWTGRRTDRAGVVLHVLPGRYTVELPPARTPLVPRLADVYVPPVLGQWQTGMITVDYGLTHPGEARARSVILGALARCLHSTVARPPDCPVGADLPPGTRGSWRLVELPEISYAEMMGDTLDFRGRGLVAEFTELPGPAASGMPGPVPTARETTAPGSTAPEAASGLAQVPRVHRVTVDFGATLRHGRTGFTVESWGYTTLRPWLPEA